MSQFSSPEATSLEKRIELSSDIKETKKGDINCVYEIDKCAKWILDNNYKTVCLQLPDYLLPDAAEIVFQMEELINRKVYVLGDTAYGSCCIDYTAARHISADAIIHFGPTCFSKTEAIIPCLKIYEKRGINVKEFCEILTNKFTNSTDNICIIFDTTYLHKLEDIKAGINNINTKIYSIEDEFAISSAIVIYLGKNDRKLMNLYLNFNIKELHYFDPEDSNNIKSYEPDMKILKRRYFLIEKIKDSKTVGFVISTLAVRSYLKIVERLKTLARVHSKKYFLFSVGKPTEAKLANLPEVLRRLGRVSVLNHDIFEISKNISENLTKIHA